MQIPFENNVITEIYEGSRTLHSLDLEQTAVLFALVTAHKTNWKDGAAKLVPKVIAQLVSDVSKAGPEGNEQFCKKTVSMLRQLPDVQEFISRVHQAGFRFLSVPENANSIPDFSFRYVRRELVQGGTPWRLKDDQDRALRIIESDRNEHINIEGFAGSGKTHLTSALGEIFSPKTTILVAATPYQLQALKERLPGFRGSTFAAFVRETYADIHGIRPQRLAPRFSPAFNLPMEDVAAEMDFPQIKNQPPHRVAWLANDLVRKFCYGKLTQFDLNLFPWKLQKLFPAIADRWALIHAAEALWEATMRAPQNFSGLPVRSYHLMKWLDLHNLPLAAKKIKHLIFDEGHDVPPAMLRLIDASQLTAISLGDKLQYLGTGEPGSRAERVRSCYFQHSLRSGLDVSNLLNTVLEFHNNFEGYEFVGNPERKTQQIPYARLDLETLANISVQPGTKSILCGSIWMVFSVVQRLAANGIPFSLLTPPSKLLNAIHGALKIYEGNANLNTDPHSLNCKTWEDFRHQEGVVVGSLFSVFERGFKKSDLKTSLSKANAENPKALRVGLVEEAKNQEFDSVVLTSDIRYGNYKIPQTRSRIVSSLYTAITRGVHAVYFQEDMIEIALRNIKEGMGN